MLPIDFTMAGQKPAFRLTRVLTAKTIRPMAPDATNDDSGESVRIPGESEMLCSPEILAGLRRNTIARREPDKH